ncbi:hypothetical protein HN51_017568 [Arachis hypogaea]|uniref:pumilio homolog 12-like n=1 Tax=Arachis ipaensis TaxID=130454 RepID=UPI000A2B6EB3|nr:pumilio homolog 12-like [Arachis ipaensis]XP_025657600.1 pumilio homolog 12 [Arachis hypogaea]QHN88541.1 uncharacterized protein DS421_16g564350 [Arachis hypogaea]
MFNHPCFSCYLCERDHCLHHHRYHAFEGQNQIPFYKNHRVIDIDTLQLQEAFSRVSLTPHNNNPDFSGQRSTFDEEEEGYEYKYPFVSPNPSSYLVPPSMQHSNTVPMNESLMINANNSRRNVHRNFNGTRSPQSYWSQRPCSSVNYLRGKILDLAKTQCGCRVLQDTMKGLTSKEEVFVFFQELVDHNVIELMGHSFGNYVFQKLVEICSEEQITTIVFNATKNVLKFVNLCLDIHGTRSVQKLLEHVTNQEQRLCIMSALTPSVVALSTNTNGLHVVDHCVKHFSSEDTKYMLNIVATNCFKIATDKSGCCVIQQFVDHAPGESKDLLMAGIILNAPLLAENCYGNYVVQHLVSLKIARVTKSLMKQLEGKFVSMSCNKYGSNVVEKFFQDSGESHSRSIILELLHYPNVSMLLVDPYANFVISSAVIVSKGGTQEELLKVIKQHSPMMRSNHYGKKLLGRLRKFLCHV